MATVDLTYSWQHVSAFVEQLETPNPATPAMIVVPHEETDLHRVFCDDHFCLDELSAT